MGNIYNLEEVNMERISSYRKYLFLGVGIILLIISLYFYFKTTNYNDISSTDNIVSDNLIVTTEQITTSNKLFVDVKGSVKSPGVYEFMEGDKIIDAINKAGGINKNATTDNINLSKKLVNEMVIYVFNKNELTTTKIEQSSDTICKCETIEVNNCTQNNNNSDESNNLSSKININTDNKDKLMTLNGIGSSKADAIIEYRNKNGNFKSTQDIINVSGISSTIYEKIKDNITV